MRDLQQSDKNSITVDDRLSGTKLELFYRMPTNDERIAYQRSTLKREGNKLKLKVFESRVKYGLQILTGFREGDFGYGGEPISADPTSQHYRADWKDLLQATASDIVATVAGAVFESARFSGDEGIEFVDEGGEEVLPLPKN